MEGGLDESVVHVGQAPKASGGEKSRTDLSRAAKRAMRAFRIPKKATKKGSSGNLDFGEIEHLLLIQSWNSKLSFSH